MGIAKNYPLGEADEIPPANKLLMGEVIFTSPFISSFVSKVISPLL